MDFPRRIFLDTCVINFIIDYWEHIFDSAPIENDVSYRVYDDICAIAQIFYCSDRNPVEMIISNTTFKEIEATTDVSKRERLLNFCSKLWKNYHYLIDGDYRYPGFEVKYFEEYLYDKGLSYLNDANDRRLIVEALFYKCDIFCTRDYRTILKYRLNIKRRIIPLEILTPLEWRNRYSYIKAY